MTIEQSSDAANQTPVAPIGPEPEEQKATPSITIHVRTNANAAPRWERNKERGGWQKGDRFVTDAEALNFERRMREGGVDQLRGVKMPARLDLLVGELEDR